jgi:Tfp pilus assembly PilM family ATPase
MAPRVRTTCGLEISRAALCVAQYYPEDHSVASVAITPFDGAGEEWWKAVQSEFANLSTAMKLAGQDVVCCVPAESTVIKRLELDKDEDPAEDAIQWEIAQHIIGSMDDYTIGSEKVTDGLAFDAARYLVVACRTAHVDRLASLLRSNRVNPIVVDVDVFALINVYEANYRENIGVPALLILGGDEFSKVVLTADGTYIDHEHFRNAPDNAEPGKYSSMIKAACDRLLTVNVSVAGKTTTQVYVAGPAFADEQFAARCMKDIGKAEILNPFKKIACRAPIEARYSPQLAVAVGLALRDASL